LNYVSWKLLKDMPKFAPVNYCDGGGGGDDDDDDDTPLCIDVSNPTSFDGNNDMVCTTDNVSLPAKRNLSTIDISSKKTGQKKAKHDRAIDLRKIKRDNELERIRKVFEHKQKVNDLKLKMIMWKGVDDEKYKKAFYELDCILMNGNKEMEKTQVAGTDNTSLEDQHPSEAIIIDSSSPVSDVTPEIEPTSI
jgi:hypothetical protein